MSRAQHVFTYGSLMFDAVWCRVVRGHYRSEPCEIEGYQRFAIRSESYPAMVRMAGVRLAGRLWLDVLPDDLARLDRFEGPEYQRIEIAVAPARASSDDRSSLPAVSVWRTAQAYLWLDGARLTDLPWDPALFERERLEDFLRRHGAQSDMGGA